MNKTLLIIFILISGLNIGSSQNEIYFGIRGALASKDIYKTDDKGNLMQSIDYFQVLEDIIAPEIFFGGRFYKNFIFEFAFRGKNYKMGFYNKNEFPDNDPKDNFKYSIFTNQFPCKLKYKYDLNNTLSIRPYIGFTFAINVSPKGIDDFNYNPFASKHFLLGVSLVKADYIKTSFLTNIGTDLQLNINKRSSIVFNLEYVNGFKDLATYKLGYAKINPEGEQYLSTIYGQGDYIYLGFAYKYNLFL